MKRLIYFVFVCLLVGCTEEGKIRPLQYLGIVGDAKYVSVYDSEDNFMSNLAKEVYVLRSNTMDIMELYDEDVLCHYRMYYDNRGNDSLWTSYCGYDYTEKELKEHAKNDSVVHDKYNRVIEHVNDGFATKVFYNGHGDISRIENGGCAMSGIYIKKGSFYYYEYEYDSIGNWTRRKEYMEKDNSLSSTVIRKIEYGKIYNKHIEEKLTDVEMEERRIRFQNEAKKCKAGKTGILHGFEFGMTESQIEQHKNKLKETGGLVRNWIWGWVVSIPTTSTSNAEAILMIPEYYNGGMRSVRFQIDGCYHASGIWEALTTANPDAQWTLTKNDDERIYSMFIDNIIITLKVDDSDADLEFTDAPYIDLMEQEQKSKDKEKSNAYKM